MYELHFNSTITNPSMKEPQIIEFKSNTEYQFKKGFHVFSFDDPSNKEIKNIIEISKEEVNIFTGPSTLNLELGKKIKIDYEIENVDEHLFFTSFLEDVKIEEKKNGFYFFIKYNLLDGANSIGKYNLVIKVKKI